MIFTEVNVISEGVQEILAFTVASTARDYSRSTNVPVRDSGAVYILRSTLEPDGRYSAIIRDAATRCVVRKSASVADDHKGALLQCVKDLKSILTENLDSLTAAIQMGDSTNTIL